MKLYLGTHQPSWLADTNTPLMVSYPRLARRKNFPEAEGDWIQDSGGFTEITQHGRYRTPAAEYAKRTRYHKSMIGGMEYAAPQDWMCENIALRATGLDIRTHQQLTITNLIELRRLAPNVPWFPVLQGQSKRDYLDHLVMYAWHGIPLEREPLVGVGSICRRQHTDEAADIITTLAGYGLKLHGFGFKIQGLKKVHQYLTSADSLAWSFDARRLQRPTCGSTSHKNCANCRYYAEGWYLHVGMCLHTLPNHT